MKKFKKLGARIIAVALVAVLAIPAMRADAASTGFSYDPAKAVAFAEANWNVEDGTVCDQFVKNSLHAGGVVIRAGGVDEVKNALADAGFGSICAIKTMDNDPGGRILASENPGVKAGDVLFFYCEDCGKSVHTTLVGGFDEDGYMYCYGHNPAWEKVQWMSNFKHTADDGTLHSNFKFYAVKMDVSVKDHKHDFGISHPTDLHVKQVYEKEHPHKYYDQCAVDGCNAKYYLGWNATVSSCYLCNPSPNGVPVLSGQYDAEKNVVKLNWTAIKDVENYTVSRKNTSIINGAWYDLGTVNAASFTNGSGEDGVTYAYKIKAGSVESNILEITWGGEMSDTPVLADGGLNAEGKPTLKWTAAKDAAKYRVYRTEVASGAKDFWEVTTLSYTHGSALDGTTYEYQVCAVLADGKEAPLSNKVTITAGGVKEDTPVVVDNGFADGYKPKLKWDKVSGAIGYHVYRTEKESGKVADWTVTTISTTNGSVKYGVTYEYQVAAMFVGDVEGPRSNVVTITVPYKEHTHEFGGWIAVVKPTYETEGVKERVCKLCEETETGTLKKLTGTWKYDSKGYWFRLSDGSYLKDCKAVIGGKTYAFNAEGYMITGWVLEEDGWHFYDTSSGAMAVGWKSVGGTWYYMDSTGLMKTGWIKSGSAWYYMKSSGAMATGWVQVGAKWYYMSGSGIMQTGWLKSGSSWYYLNSSGAMTTGWQKVSGAWYYMNPSGTMATNKWIGNYYVLGSGRMATNQWIGSYYVGADGVWVRGMTR